VCSNFIFECQCTVSFLQVKCYRFYIYFTLSAALSVYLSICSSHWHWWLPQTTVIFLFHRNIGGCLSSFVQWLHGLEVCWTCSDSKSLRLNQAWRIIMPLLKGH
jgi:hypothetical protein